MLKNIIIVANGAYDGGGMSQVSNAQAILFAQRGYSVHYFIGASIAEADPKLLKIPGISFTALNQKSLFGDPNRLKMAVRGIYNFKVAKAFEEFLSGFDRNDTVVHVHSYLEVLSPCIFAVAKKMGFPVFVTMHMYSIPCPNNALFNFVKQEICEVPPMSIKCIMCNCDKRNYSHKLWRVLRQVFQNRILMHNRGEGIGFIFISDFSRRQILRRIPEPRNHFLVPNPINFGNFSKGGGGTDTGLKLRKIPCSSTSEDFLPKKAVPFSAKLSVLPELKA